MKLTKAEQARVNGAKSKGKSKGPVTAEGKARCSMNAIKHGRFATNAVVLKNEDPLAFEELVASYMLRVQPVDPVESHLVRKLAAIDWRLNRTMALDTRMLDHEMDIQAPALLATGQTIAELTRLERASESIVDRSRLPDYLTRHEAHLIEARQRTIQAIRDLRKNFPPIEPASQITPPMPLNPEATLENEPQTNPNEGSEGRAGSAGLQAGRQHERLATLERDGPLRRSGEQRKGIATLASGAPLLPRGNARSARSAGLQAGGQHEPTDEARRTKAA